MKEFFELLKKFDIKGIMITPTSNSFLQIVRYVFVGGVATVVDFALLYLFTDVCQINYLVSAIFAFIGGFISNFVLSKLLVFNSKAVEAKVKPALELLGHFLIAVIGLGLTALIMYVCTDMIGIFYLVSKIIATAIVLFWNFIARKKILYTDNGVKKAADTAKKIGVLFLTIGLLSIVGFVAIVGVYKFFPLQYKSMAFVKSKDVLKNENTYETITDSENSHLDNYSDAVMLLTACYPVYKNDSGDVVDYNGEKTSYIEQAMLNNRLQYNSPPETLSHDLADAKVEPYTRYWHGYLVFLKPLLSIFNLKQIRIIDSVMQGVLLATLLLLLYKRGYKFLIIPFLCAYIFISPLTVAISLQYSSNWYIVLIGNIVYLAFQDKIIKHNLHYILFAVVGALTSYFDLFSYPIITMGLLLVIVISTEKLSFWKAVQKVLACGLSWMFGYAFMWIAKFVCAAIVLNSLDIFENARGAVEHHQGFSEYNGLGVPFDWIYDKLLLHSPTKETIKSLTIINIVFGAGEIIWTIIKNKNEKVKNFIKKHFKASFTKDSLDELDDFKFIKDQKTRLYLNILARVAVIIGISMIPWVWCFLIRNHTFIHAFMTYRILAVFYFALYVLLHKCAYDLDRLMK
jgi:putative flippase GtrA